MARSSRYPCRHAHCGVLLRAPGHCDMHRPKLSLIQTKNSDEDYKERNRFYQRKAWKTLRASHLQSEPLCRSCRRIGRLVEATAVDHIVPITMGGQALDDCNLQSLCKSCHARKTLDEGRMSGISSRH
jgi:5-methylcytosine-specific restriction protein A